MDGLRRGGKAGKFCGAGGKIGGGGKFGGNLWTGVAGNEVLALLEAEESTMPKKMLSSVFLVHLSRASPLNRESKLRYLSSGYKKAASNFSLN